jgi:bromodomain-containing protein 4
MKHKYAWPFNKPVDTVKLEIPDYLDIIETPMDFGTIKKRLDENYYITSEECINDIEIVFSNCYQYNKSHTDVYVMAIDVQKVFRELVSKMPPKMK